MNELEDHLFRRESGRMIAALTRLFGPHNLALAEDVVQDAFCRALEVWRVRGLPENPAAWLMTVAKRRALDVLRREHLATRSETAVGWEVEDAASLDAEVEGAFEPHAIRDEQLRMMFTCCHPRLPEEVQVALILNVLCGFGAGEIAAAFLVGRAAMEKRLARGKRALARTRRSFDLAHLDFAPRLGAVRRALYLLFNEGYHGASATAVRAELCGEALRLARLLREHPPADDPETAALASLMCLHLARLPARVTIDGELRTHEEQDRAHWDASLIAEGLALLEASARGGMLSAWHLESAIAATHASAPTAGATDWATIVSLYDRLVRVAPSPVVELNRAIAIAERDGVERGLAALAAIDDRDRLARYPFLHAAFGALEARRGHVDAARAHFDAALGVARNEAERRFLRARLAALAGHTTGPA